MDSFYGHLSPRDAPTAARYLEKTPEPSVPEISLMLDKPRRSPKPSYNYWKINNPKIQENSLRHTVNPYKENQLTYNTHNYPAESNSFFKKQVRFQSPAPNVASTRMIPPPNCSMTYRLPQTNEFRQLHPAASPKNRFLKSELELSILEPRPPLMKQPTVRSNEFLIGRDFGKQVINEPCEQIDFSMVPFKEAKYHTHSPKKSTKTKTYRDWVVENTNKELHENDECGKTDKDPTVGDLYQIIQEQNNHLKSLQKQVETLLEQTKPSNEVNSNADVLEILPNYCEHCQHPPSESVKMTNPVQISIGVMTSFELNLRNSPQNQSSEKRHEEYSTTKKHTFDPPPANIKEVPKLMLPNTSEMTPLESTKLLKNSFLPDSKRNVPQNTQFTTNVQRKNVYSESPISSKPATTRRPEPRCRSAPEKFPDNSRNNLDVTEDGNNPRKEFSLCEIPEIPEPLDVTPTPSSSIHVDMQEFSESDESGEDETEFRGNNIGWTIYNNVVGQVQNILDKSPKDGESSSERQERNDRLIDNVKQATLNQLHNLGISINEMHPRLPDKHLINRCQFGSGDLSIEVNQLVMKYLRDDQLSMLISKGHFFQPTMDRCCPSSDNSVPDLAFDQGGNEISFATVKYMQKYQLWGQGTKHNVQVVSNQLTPEMAKHHLKKNFSQNKILDITALKQQPKLL